jgi:hypothetical protein
LPGFYFNNRGSLQLRISRLAEAAMPHEQAAL